VSSEDAGICGCSMRKVGTRDATFIYNLRISSDLIQGVDKIMETLRNLGIEFVLATLKELCSSVCLHFVVLTAVH
jgi:hypothetical protein